MPESRKIIRNAYILPCDGNGTGGIGTVTVRNDRITSVSYGRSREEVPAADVEVIEGTGKILLPGFIDLHFHGESMLLDILTAGEPQGRWQRMPEYVKAQEYWYQHASRDDWSRLYTTVCYQALRSGVTFLGEFGVPEADGACSAALDAFARTEMPGMLTLHNADHLEFAQQAMNSSLLYTVALPPTEELTTYNLQASLRMSREAGYPLLLHMNDAERDVDTLIGGMGDDTYRVDDLSDGIVEQSGEGTDTVQTSISFVLAANLENLTLTGSFGVGGTGNASDNILIGGENTVTDASDNYVDGLVTGLDIQGICIETPFCPSPFQGFLVNVRNNGSMDLTLDGDDLPQQDDVNGGGSLFPQGAGLHAG